MFLRYDGKLYFSDGEFHSMYCDWNNDNDWYTDTVMFCHGAKGELLHLNKYDRFEVVPDAAAEAETRAAIAECFTPFKSGYCDPTHGGSEHFTNWRFMKGGRVTDGTEEDRQKAIDTELAYVLKWWKR